MNYTSIVTNAEIVELLQKAIILGEENPTKRQEAMQELLTGLEHRVTIFGQNVEAELDEEIKSLLARAEIMGVVERIAGKTVHDLIDRRLEEGNLRTNAYREVKYRATYLGDGLVEVGVDVQIFNGVRTKSGQVMSDHKYIGKHVLGDLRTIGLNGFDPDSGLNLKISGKPQTTLLTEPAKLEGRFYPFPYLVEAKYVARIPMETLVANYGPQMRKS